MNKYILVSYLPDLSFWICITLLRNYRNKDVKLLKNKYFKNTITGWQISHFISYLAKGFYFKEKNFFYFFFIGLCFEFLEYYIEYFTNINFVDSSILIDPLINSSGFIFGIFSKNVYRYFNN